MRSSADDDAIQTFDLQTLIARTPALCLSGAVIRRSELTAVGGFDEGLRTDTTSTCGCASRDAAP